MHQTQIYIYTSIYWSSARINSSGRRNVIIKQQWCMDTVTGKVTKITNPLMGKRHPAAAAAALMRRKANRLETYQRTMLLDVSHPRNLLYSRINYLNFFDIVDVNNVIRYYYSLMGSQSRRQKALGFWRSRLSQNIMKVILLYLWCPN